MACKSPQKIIVVGAGPAGIMAAIRASQLKQEVYLIEKNADCARKLLLSGKGRCNLTNTCELNAFLEKFSANGQFLRDALKRFFYPQLMNFFEERGLKLKIERQQRVFPATDRSSSVKNVLVRELKANKVKILLQEEVINLIVKDGRLEGVITKEGRRVPAHKVILATGGVSYPFTGSDGRGIEIARAYGHKIVPLRPGLVGLVTGQDFPANLEGLVLKNIRLKFSYGKKQVISEIGELLFTESGVSGPLVLTLSGQVADWLNEAKGISLYIDLKPGLTPEQLGIRLLKEFKASPKKSIRNILRHLLPNNLIPVFLQLAGIAQEKKSSSVTQGERRDLIRLFKGLRLDIIKTRPIEEAMVTRGGVSLKGINPRTMESRLIPGLYFCGEMIDIDADTGGFNLQAAFSTGFLAGESAAQG